MEPTRLWPLGCLLLSILGNAAGENKENYYGKFIGKLSQLHHGLSGDVFAVDARTLHLRNFNYDGEGPAAYFYAGNSKVPSGTGFRIRDERGSTNPLPRYRGKHITVTLPEGKTLHNIKWFSVWCEEFSVNFGDVKIPKGLDFPRPSKIGALSGIHGVSSDQIVIVDAQTLLLPNFSYDGEAPDAKFWVGRGNRPTPQGIRIPDENGKVAPLRRYDKKTIVLTLPTDLTVYDIGHFGVWCEAFTVDFGHVLIPREPNVPPSLKMLGVSPQSKLNCEVLWDDLAFEVRWAVAGDSIVLQLVSKLEDGEYMAFGLSGDEVNSKMVGGDVTVAWVDKETLKGHAQDYFLDAKSQCSGGRGSCPDDNVLERTNSVRLLNAALVNGYSIVTFQRSLRAQDELDKPVLTNGSQPVIWAVGPLNARQEVSYHSLANRGNVHLDFGRSPRWNCPTPENHGAQQEQQEASSNNKQSTEEQVTTTVRQQSSSRREPSRPKPVPTPAPVPKNSLAWDIPAIQCHEPEDGVFYAQMGPTGGKRGYSAITGHVGWGISWYINGLLIPEINVVRGKTYTFIVEGGLDPETPARYHPFYITDDSVGGYEYKTPEERANIQIFAGAVQNKRGEVRPTGTGRLCNWTPDLTQPPADEFSSFGAYQRTLRLECDQGEPGIVQWTVDRDTPDTVYYQCYTHRYLGWKINVLDECETEQASEPIPSVVKAPEEVIDKISIEEEDSEGQTSIQHATRVKPDLPKESDIIKINKTQSFGNQISKYEPQIQFVPEFTFYNQDTGEPISAQAVPQSKYQEELKNFQNHFMLQDPYFQQHLVQQLVPVPQTPPKAIPIPHIPVKVPDFKNNDQFLQYFHPQSVANHQPPQIHPLPQTHHRQTPQVHHQLLHQALQKPQGLSMYSVNEPQVEEAAGHRPHYHLLPQRTEQEYHLVPQRKPDLDILSSVQNIHYKNNVTHRPFESTTEFDEKFNEEFLKNYQILKAQAEENLKKQKHKLQYHKGATNRLPNGQPIHTRLQYNTQALRRPVPHHALTLQQRPMPPGAFRPPFMPPPVKKHSKRPVQAASQKVPSYSHPNSLPHRPPTVVRPKRPTSPKPLKHPGSMSVQQYLALQSQLALLTTPKAEIDTSAMLTSSPVMIEKTTESALHAPSAVNTGFNPESVKVEGGFKPILSTGIAPNFKIVKRMDEDVQEDETQEEVGVIDLSEDTIGEKSALFKDPKEELIKIDRNVTEEPANSTNEDRDLFKNQKPQMFEPMFVPSPPDHRVQKNPEEKHKKKPVGLKSSEMTLKHRNQQLQHYNTQKGNYYIKIRPRPNLIRRPLYPNNVVAPFKIPVRGGAPQYRYQQSEESVEDTTDFDIINMNNETVNTEDDKAENILEVLEMEEGEENTTEDATAEDMEKNGTSDEMAMADERRDFYLPPKTSGVVTYDGKVVKAAPVPTLPERRTKFDVSKLPQSVPYRGEAPPLTANFNPGNLPQLKNTQSARKDILPPQAFPDPPSIRSTQLSLVKNDQYESQASETEEVFADPDLQVTNESKIGEIEREGKRAKRSPDHEPGHVGPHEHDHDDHDHHNHTHPTSSALHLCVSTTLIFLTLALHRVM